MFSHLSWGRISRTLAGAVLLVVGLSPALADGPRLDAQGDPLPAGAVGRLGTIRFRAAAEVKTLVFSPDGRTLVSGSADGIIRFWDPQTGKELRRLTGHEHAVNCLAFSPDGKTLASGSYDQTARLWDVASGKLLHRITSKKGWVTSVAFSPDGKTLACANRGNLVTLHDTATGELTRDLEGHGIWVTAVVFSKDGKTVVSAAKDRTIRRWDATTGEERGRFEGQSTMVFALAVSPDGRTLASGSNDNAIHLWNMETGTRRRKLEGHDGSVSGVTYAADGRTVASASRDGTIRLWDPETGKVRQVISAEEGEVLAIAVSPDSKTIASAGKSQTIRLWETETGKEAGVRRDGHAGGILGLAFTRDGRELLTNSRDATLRLWSVESGKHRLSLRGHRYPPYGMALSPDGKTLATVSEDRTVRSWALADGAPGPVREIDPNETIDLTFSPDNLPQAWVAGPANREVRNRLNVLDNGNYHDLELRDLPSGKSRQRFQVDAAQFQGLKNQMNQRAAFQVVMEWPSHLERLSAVAISHGRTLVATGSYDKNICLWETSRGKLIHKMVGHEGTIASLAFSADDRLVISTSADGTVRLWEVATRRPVAVVPPIKGDVRAAALSPDGRTLAWASATDDRIRLWDVIQNRDLPMLEGHGEPVNILAFSPDSRLLASGGLDTTVLLWDVKTVLDKARLAPDSFQDVRDTTRLWAQLASDDAAAGYGAVWTLTGSKPEQALAFLKDRIKLEAGKQRSTAELIGDLDSGAFQVRRQATETLENLGEIIRPDVLKALDDQPSFEMRRRLEQILTVLDNRRGRLTQEELRQVRVVLALEWLGTPEPRDLLQQIAKGPANWWQTREAIAALQRLGAAK